MVKKKKYIYIYKIFSQLLKILNRKILYILSNKKGMP